MFYLKMSTIAQRKKFKHLSFGFITKKKNLTDVQFSFEESNIHQKILLKKAPPLHYGDRKRRFRNT